MNRDDIIELHYITPIANVPSILEHDILAQSLRDKLDAKKAIKALERTRNTKRRELFDAQDAINAQREELIAYRKYRETTQTATELPDAVCFPMEGAMTCN